MSKRPAFTERSGEHRQRLRREISAAHRSFGATGFRNRPGAGFFVSWSGNGPPRLQLKELRGRSPRYNADSTPEPVVG